MKKELYDQLFARMDELGAIRKIEKEKEGCQAFSMDCGIRNKETGNFICEYCRRWNGQQRTLLIRQEAVFTDVSKAVLKRFGTIGVSHDPADTVPTMHGMLVTVLDRWDLRQPLLSGQSDEMGEMLLASLA